MHTKASLSTFFASIKVFEYAIENEEVIYVHNVIQTSLPAREASLGVIKKMSFGSRLL